MAMYQEGYDYYVSKCEQFGLEPINFYLFLQNLSQEQLDTLNKHVEELLEGTNA